MAKFLIFCLSILALAGCDSNSRPEFGDSGLPKNCRAYVQVAVDSYRTKRYSTNKVMDGLERNCGVQGHLWK